jgi:hypothetical protein
MRNKDLQARWPKQLQQPAAAASGPSHFTELEVQHMKLQNIQLSLVKIKSEKTIME